jgi:hypothetical protein
MKAPRYARVPVACLALAMVVTGCAKTTGSPPTPSPVTAASTAAAPATGYLQAPPPALPGVATLAVIEPRTGPGSTAVSVGKGSIWIFLACSGGSLTIEAENVASMPFTCESPVSQYANEIELTAAQDVRIAVTPGDASVRWSVRIGQAGS